MSQTEPTPPKASMVTALSPHPTLTADDKGSLPGEFWQARKAKSVSQKEKVQPFLPLLPPPAARKDRMDSLHQVISLRTDLRFFQFPEVEK